MDEKIKKIVEDAILIEELEAKVYQELIPHLKADKVRGLVMNLLERERLHKIKLEYYLEGKFPQIGEHCPVPPC